MAASRPFATSHGRVRRMVTHRRSHSNTTSLSSPSSSSSLQRSGVYVHWPFCAKRCSYCNFNKYIAKELPLDPSLLDRMRRCLVTELRTLLRLSGVGEGRVQTVFFGGGTPSLMRPDDVEVVLETVREFGHKNQLEVTLEANPADVVAERDGGDLLLRQFAQAGVNRISLGVQTFSDALLRSLNRDHNSKAASASLRAALDIFPRESVSADLIFGLPGQTMEQWRSDLEAIAGFGPGHVAVYQLTLERGTPLWKSVRSGLPDSPSLPGEEVVADMYDAAVETLGSAAGLRRYEVSNFASVPAARCRHNRGYWTGCEFVGVGPGAHGRFRARNREIEPDTGRRACDVIMRRSAGCEESRSPAPAVRESRVQTLEPANWMREVELAGHATRLIRRLSHEEFICELLATALRTEEGLTRETWAARLREYDGDGDGALVDVEVQELLMGSERCRRMLDSGTVQLDSAGMRLSAGEGIKIADHLLPYIINGWLEVAEKRRGGRRKRAANRKE